LVSLSGLFIYCGLMYLISKNPDKVRWHTVIWGFALQLFLAIIILKWSLGYLAFQWLGERITNYLNYVDSGCMFLFGNNYEDHIFAMKILPTVIFVSSTINILFYLGLMQKLIVSVAQVIQFLLRTSACESFVSASNIFMGMGECPILIRPMLPSLTNSEIHAIMAGGFATISGSVMAAFIYFGVSAPHLISASVMSAPAALAIAKLVYPETEKPTMNVDSVNKFKPPEKSIFEAASAGAGSAISLAAIIGANLIAFISLLESVNQTLVWFGKRVGSKKTITFQYIISYLLWPFALTMGVKVEDCRKVGELIGVKTFINEFVAFQELGTLIKNRKKLNEHIAKNGTWSSERSVVISTYALCGFSNFGSIGIQIGMFTVLIPERKTIIPKLATRAMVVGSVSCFVTACIASR
ncbi:hypothetical protein HELRODRAFT_62058, partial [Helobdella robusta]|uniref:Sodium/nucleoside cotransporter n=1 Tax=Helobdella robusta TaxID=6412 RepID=T1FWV0_HELRO